MKKTFPFIALLLAVLGFASGPLFGQKLTSKPAVALPEPVEVMGYVEVLGEAHKQPFILSQSVTLNGDEAQRYVEISVPAGKRVVIESVTAIAEVPVGSRPRGTLYVGSEVLGISSGSVPISFTEEGPWSGRVIWHSTSTVKVRFDTDVHQLALSFRRPGSGYTRFDLTLFGYIEDLAAAE